MSRLTANPVSPPVVGPSVGPELHALAIAVGDALSAALPAPSMLSHAGTAPVGGPAFVVLLRTRSGQALAVQLDAPAARAVADAVLIGEGGLRGTGAPGQVERGALEFVALSVLDALHRTGALRPGTLRIERFCGDADVPVVKGPELHWTLATASGAGTLTLSGAIVELSAATAATLGLPQWCRHRADAGDAHVTMGVGLPAIALNDAERRAARPGDLLLLPPAERWATRGAAVGLVTPGWVLGDATVDAPSAEAITVTPAAWRPRREVTTGNAVRPLLGATPMLLTDLEARATAGATPAPIDFDLCRASPLELYAGTVRLGAAELVRETSTGRACARLTEWSAGSTVQGEP